MPDFTNNTVTVPGREGVFDFGETIGERKIEISCFIPPGKTDEEFLARKDEIIAWLNPDNGLCDLILDKEPGRVYRARLEGGFSFDKAVRNSAPSTSRSCAPTRTPTPRRTRPTNSPNPVPSR